MLQDRNNKKILGLKIQLLNFDLKNKIVPFNLIGCISDKAEWFFYWVAGTTRKSLKDRVLILQS